MKESFWIYLLMILGLFIIVVMMLIQDLTSTSEEDYYLAKEALEASMVDALDLGLYREKGEIRIIESKFVESFIRRFAESVNDSKNYTIEFYEIYEMPPKATVFIKTKSKSVKVGVDSEESYDILTAMSGILETKDYDHYGTTWMGTTTDDGEDDDDSLVVNNSDVVNGSIYWSLSQGGEAKYRKSYPQPTISDVRNIGFTKGALIKMDLNNREVSNQQVCTLFNGNTVCIAPNYWYGNENVTKISLEDLLKDNKATDVLCTASTGVAKCSFNGGLYCYANGEGTVECGDHNNYCCTIASNGLAWCSDKGCD